VTNTFGCLDSLSKIIIIIDPIVDIAVTNLSYELITGTNYLRVTALLTNFGTVDISSIDLILEMSSNRSILENWEGSIPALSQLDYEFSGAFEVAEGEIPDLLCVTATKPNNQADDQVGNNEFCIATNDFLLISIGPNPTDHFLNIDYIVPFIGDVSINLYNLVGEKVKSLFSGKVEKGVTRASFDMQTISSGVYIVELSFGKESIKNKIIIR